MSDRPDITIPEEAWALLITEPSVEETERAAALIVAAWLDGHADAMNEAAKYRRVNEDSWDRGWHSAWASATESLRQHATGLRAAELRGGAQ